MIRTGRERKKSYLGGGRFEFSKFCSSSFLSDERPPRSVTDAWRHFGYNTERAFCIGWLRKGYRYK